MEFKNSSLAQLPGISKAVLTLCKKENVVCFYGEMGSGKTTLIKQICKDLGVLDEVKSPTFSLVNEYKNGDGDIVYHFDFYRINSLEEVYDIGIEEYFDSGNLMLVEWPEKVEELLPTSYVKVNLEYAEDSRSYILSLLE